MGEAERGVGITNGISVEQKRGKTSGKIHGVRVSDRWVIGWGAESI